MTMRFPKTLAAVERRERDTWALADAVLAECPLGGTRDRLADCAAELARQGYSYALRTLSNYRETAAAFPGTRERLGCSVDVCRLAQTPAMLAALVQMAARQRKELTADLVLEWSPVIRNAQAKEHERQRAKAREVAEGKVRKAEAEKLTATTPAARQRAERKLERAREEQNGAAAMPVPDPTAVKPEVVNTLLAYTRIVAAGAEAQAQAHEALALLEKTYDQFDPEQQQLIREAAQAAMNDWGTIVGYRRDRTSQRPAII